MQHDDVARILFLPFFFLSPVKLKIIILKKGLYKFCFQARPEALVTLLFQVHPEGM